MTDSFAVLVTGSAILVSPVGPIRCTINFQLSIYFPPTHGWTVKVVNIHSGNDGVGDLEEVMDDHYFEDKDDNNDDKSVEEEEAEDNDAEMRKHSFCTPLQLDWIVPLIRDVIVVKPNTSNAGLHHIL